MSNQKGIILWPEASALKQGFSLPSTIIYYVSKNPSSHKVYSKLIQSCIKFFEKNPILVIKCIHYGNKQLYFCFERECDKNKHVVDFAIKQASKIWLTGALDYQHHKINSSYIGSKIYRCDNAFLTLWYIEISLEDFKIYASKFQHFNLKVNVVDKNGSTVLFDEIIESTLKIKIIVYYFDTKTAVTATPTMKNILRNNKLCNLEKLSFLDVPEFFPVDDLANYIRKNKDTKCWLQFGSNISDEYKNELGILVDKIIESERRNCYIFYPGIDRKKSKLMESRFSHWIKVI